MGKGRKSVDRTGWMRPGGSLPAKCPGLDKREQAIYKWLIGAMSATGMGGKSDLMLVTMTARTAARCDTFRDEIAKLPNATIKNAAGGQVMHPLYLELAKSEVRLRDLLGSLYLTPRARGSTRQPSEAQGQANAGDGETPEAVLRLLGG